MSERKIIGFREIVVDVTFPRGTQLSDPYCRDVYEECDCPEGSSPPGSVPGSVSQVCCPGVEIPTTLYLTFLSVTVPLYYQLYTGSSTPYYRWCGQRSVGSDHRGYYFRCYNGQWYLGFAQYTSNATSVYMCDGGPASAELAPTASTCDPFSVTFNNFGTNYVVTE